MKPTDPKELKEYEKAFNLAKRELLEAFERAERREKSAKPRRVDRAKG